MDDYAGPGDYSQRMFNLGACTILILLYIAFCAPKQVIVNGVRTDSKQCYEDYKYVKAHKENEVHLSAFGRGLTPKLHNKPNILIDSSVGVCGRAADEELSRAISAGADGGDKFDKLFAELKENAGQ